jgi:hypothetical protein
MRVLAGVVALLLATVSLVGCATGCPTDVLKGTLVAADGELVVERDPAGVAIHVQWPFGVGVHDESGTLVLADVLGTVKAREGDVVGIAGSSTGDGSWVACGDISVTGTSTPKAPNE